MRRKALRLVVIGLSLSSSWGNGHATTYRALLRGLKVRGHDVLFLECDKPWYAENRDLPDPEFCRLVFYDGVEDLKTRFEADIACADAVIVGSYVPEGIELIDFVLARAAGIRIFYDIDTPVTLAKLAAGTEIYITAAQLGRFDLYLSFTGGPILKTLAEDFGVREPRAFYCAADISQHRPDVAPKRWDLGYLGTYSADRQKMLESLLMEPARRMPERRFVVAGPQYPAEIIWPANVERIEHVAPADHASFYNAQRFTLNITRADMISAGWSPSVRLFEAAACGTPVISDRWPGLAELFPDAVIIADDSAAVVTALDIGESRRVRLAERARAIVLSSHTGDARARQLETLIAQANRQPDHSPPKKYPVGKTAKGSAACPGLPAA